ncbi:uncharacterized protein LOC136075100 [Hydra vulgaris]|uniref:Uncharacterized protein LOC136075100 n=1 Tax=Hydra vulgaris TaxID=6087 RepID=A0ABM4B3N8_HYDVU
MDANSDNPTLEETQIALRNKKRVDLYRIKDELIKFRHPKTGILMFVVLILGLAIGHFFSNSKSDLPAEIKEFCRRYRTKLQLLSVQSAYDDFTQKFCHLGYKHIDEVHFSETSHSNKIYPIKYIHSNKIYPCFRAEKDMPAELKEYCRIYGKKRQQHSVQSANDDLTYKFFDEGFFSGKVQKSILKMDKNAFAATRQQLKFLQTSVSTKLSPWFPAKEEFSYLTTFKVHLLLVAILAVLAFLIFTYSFFSTNSRKVLSRVSVELKKHYRNCYGKIDEFQPLSETPTNVDLIHKFVDLCIVDSVNAQMDNVFSAERMEFLAKQLRYTPLPYSEIFMKENSVILITGIAGIGKTWFLRKCLLDWSNNLIWKNFELVFYLECWRLNQYQNISNINELLNVFYKDVLNDFNVNNHTALFIIDGLDEFKFLNELLHSSVISNYPIVNTLADVGKYKHLVAGRVYAIDQYQSLFTEHSDKLLIQIMGFNENGINNYVENNVKGEKKEILKATVCESPIAKAMTSVPFYLSYMCKIISESNKINLNSFLTMTDLYANIFLYVLQKHIKNNKLIYEATEDNSITKYILDICKIAYDLFIENKITFTKDEIQTFFRDFEKINNLFEFIEMIEKDLNCYFQFTHLTVMEFCASVYAYNCLSCKEIVANERLKICLSMICGLDKSKNSLLKFFVKLNPSKKKEEPLFLLSILDYLSKRDDYKDLFIECFYESQSLLTDQIKPIVDKIKWWGILIKDGKTPYETSCENYFVNHYISSGRKLAWLEVKKNSLSDEEKNLCIQCSRSVCNVNFHHLINFEGWKPKDNIEWLFMHISNCIITKNDFETNFFPWINLCEGLELYLHDDIDCVDNIFKWIRGSNIKELLIEYRGKYFVTSMN